VIVVNEEQVTVVLSRFVRTTNCQAFEAVLTELIAAAQTYVRASAEILRGPVAPSGRLYHVVYRFTDEGALRTWQESEERRTLAARAEALASSLGSRRLTGLEAWFDVPAQSPPSRHRMALLTWIGIWPLVSLVLFLLAPVLTGYPFLVRTALTSAVLVLVMTYAVMPLLARVASPWLYLCNDRQGCDGGN
jgi:antibiotic biosynthesis monooxygenase (ABM) superfamily enzyme